MLHQRERAYVNQKELIKKKKEKLCLKYSFLLDGPDTTERHISNSQLSALMATGSLCDFLKYS